MVEIVTKTSHRNRVKESSRIIVELVGPAGTGKTTLSRVLRQSDERIRVGPDIQLRKISHIPIFVRSVPASASFFLARERPTRWFTWTELKSIAYLKGWPRLLREGQPQDQVILLDQGPIFRLATLREFGPKLPQNAAYQRWWKDLYTIWACTLDVIVWLDASDEVLMERINTRGKAHEIKGKSDAEAQQYLRRYRKAYLDVLTKMASYNGPTVLQFDTKKVPVEQIAGDILKACQRNPIEN